MSSSSTSSSPVRVALVHDWLTGMRGGEYVLEAISEIFIAPELFTLIAFPETVSEKLGAIPRHTSVLQKIPGVENQYRKLLPVLPSIIEQFDLSGFELVLSSSSCVAKGVRRAPEAVHLSYVFAPMRYMWDRFDEYFGPGKASLAVRAAARLFRPYLRSWDRRVSQADRVDTLIGNSRYIQSQIEICYGRKGSPIFSFADLERFSAARKPEPFYFLVSAFAPYKRVDLAIEAFNKMDRPLWIVGKGQDESKLRSIAGSSIRFLGELSNAEVAELYSRCRAFVFPGQEDFGITPVEAMASGAPVIAFRAGGVLDTLTPKTAVFFENQTVDGLVEAVERFEKTKDQFLESDCRKQAALFSRPSFQEQYLKEVVRAWTERGKSLESLRPAVNERFRVLVK